MPDRRGARAGQSSLPPKKHGVLSPAGRALLLRALCSEWIELDPRQEGEHMRFWLWNLQAGLG